MSAATLLGVLAVGTVAGLDLVSVPQMMLARPLVAGFLGGAVAGRPLAGLGVGALLELFAFETLPIGAARYPDWGPAAAAAGALGARHGAAWDPVWLAGVTVVALVAAWLGGLTMHVVRRLNGAQLRRREADLVAGDPRALRALQAGGVLRDAVRAAVLTAFTYFAGGQVARQVRIAWHAPRALADVAVVGTALGVALWSAFRLYGRGAPRRWLAAGAVAGVAVVAGLLAW